MASNEGSSFQPFPNITWDQHYGERPQPGDLPTAVTTTFFDPLEKAIMASERLLKTVEGVNLSLPPSSSGTTDLIRIYRLVGNFLSAKNSAER